jgi:hypothetical protein
MADLKNYKIKWHYVLRPWGMEVLWRATNIKTGEILTDVLLWRGEKEQPQEQEVNECLSEAIDRCEAALLERDISGPIMAATQEQVLQYLKDEGIIKETQTLESVKAEMAKVG